MTSSPSRTDYIKDIARKVFFKRKRQEPLDQLEAHFHKCLGHLPFISKSDIKDAEQ